MTRKIFDKSLELAALGVAASTAVVGAAVALQITPSYYANAYQSHFQAKLVMYGVAVSSGTGTATVLTIEVSDTTAFSNKATVLSQDLGAAPAGKYEFILDFAGAQEVYGTANLPLAYIRHKLTVTGTTLFTYGLFLTKI